MTEPIIKTEDAQWEGLAVRLIHGLVALSFNVVAEEGDPRITFLRSIAAAYPCSAHIGLHEWGFDEDEMSEYLRQAPEDVECVPTPVTLFLEHIFPVRRVGGYFFPSVPLSLLDKCGTELLDYDQLALYVGANESVLNKMKELLREPAREEATRRDENQHDGNHSGYLRKWYAALGGDPATLTEENETRAFTREWLRAVASLYLLVVVTEWDGFSFGVYARDRAQLDLVSRPLEVAVEEIESSAWYREHRDELH